MVSALQLSIFDYSALDDGTRVFVETRTAEIKTLIKRSAQDIIEIGQKLTEVKARLGHGNFGAWLESEFTWSPDTAQRFINVANKFQIPQIADFDFAPSALYLLSAPSTPDEAINEAIGRAQNGERITHATAKEIVTQHKVPAKTEYWTPPTTVDYDEEVEELTGERTAYEWTDDDLEGEVEWKWRFDPATHAAYCKYCYETHSDWAKSDDHREPAWMCERCEHYSADAFLEISKSKPQPEPPTIRYVAPLPDIEDGPTGNARDHSPHKMSVHFSSDSPEHYTPKDVLEAVIACMDYIDLDPCSNSKTEPNVPADFHYTIDDDGLSQVWQGKVYMNPPYGREIGKWVEKLRAEYDSGNVKEAIALVPARTDTDWFDRLIDGYQFHCFVHGRLTFIGNDSSAPFPSAIVYLGTEWRRFYNAFRSFGRIVQETHPEMFGA